MAEAIQLNVCSVNIHFRISNLHTPKKSVIYGFNLSAFQRLGISLYHFRISPCLTILLRFLLRFL
jgi:hypothetical protein